MLQVMEPKFILRNLQQNNQSLFKKAAGMFRGFFESFFLFDPLWILLDFSAKLRKKRMLLGSTAAF